MIRSINIRDALIETLAPGAMPKREVRRRLFRRLRPQGHDLRNSGRANIPRWPHRCLTEVAHMRAVGSSAPNSGDRNTRSLMMGAAYRPPTHSPGCRRAGDKIMNGRQFSLARGES